MAQELQIKQSKIVQSKFSKNQIRKLGDTIRQEGLNSSEETLLKLQEYRTSYKDSLAEVFAVVNEESNKFGNTSITTYRIKRIDSVIRKLHRIPTMELDRMWDIAGCRSILYKEADIYKLKEAIGKRLFIKDVNDYCEKPQSSGYRSIHIYACINKDDKNVIEIQLRSTFHHNWATLVEIIDFVYDKKIKEGERNIELEQFHLLMSKKTNLKKEEKKQIVQIVNKHDIYGRLQSIFARNYLEVRKKWMELKREKSNHFFIIETTKEDVPNIISFNCFSEAEDEYFRRFRLSPNANIVLTCVPRANYEDISKAYSNYILTVHTFLDDFFELLYGVITDSVKNREVMEFYKYFTIYINTIFAHQRDIEREYVEIVEFRKNNKKNKEVKYWEDDYQKRFLKRKQSINSFNKKIINSYPKQGFSKMRFSIAFYLIRRKIKKLNEKK